MKKGIVLSLVAAFLLNITIPVTWAQGNAADEFTLEEILVTAEKRTVNVQSIPASVQALPGDDLVIQGKVTASQMLENVPNLIYGEAGRGAGGPNNNITIRGVKRTQDGGGGTPIPSATATYVDGVYDGIGGNYDIDRIEVLRGPQGTLYGRSATGGVVAFYTQNPKLEEFGGNVIIEYGSGKRINTQGAMNVPIGDKVALRAAVHYLHQDEGYFLDDKGGGNETKEGRIKALFQPTEQFSALLSLSAAETQSKSGGWAHVLTGPNDIDYDYSYTEPSDGIPNKYKQGSLELNYDLGNSALTYIGAIHSLDNRGQGGAGVNRGSVMRDDRGGVPTKTQTHEMRWASDSDGPISWLIGANYYNYKYNYTLQVTQVSVLGDDDPTTFNAPVFGQQNKGEVKDYGIFTEETFELRDDIRITAGLRYDKTDITNLGGFDFNKALKLSNGASLVPADVVHFPEDAAYFNDSPTFDNVTYKLRFEYDLTPENMVYALTATGFLPGTSQISPSPNFGPLPGGGFGVSGVDFHVLPYDQEKLTSYEVGSKNRFLNNRLQVNGALFYLDYDGYQEAVNIKPPSLPPPPEFVVVRVPVRMYGLEVDLTWLLTQYDKVTFTGGWLDAKLKSYPDIPTPEGGIQSTKQFISLKRVPGLPEVTANLGYDHTFVLANGSSLVPRAEVRYTSGYYVGQATELEAATTDDAGNSYLKYLHQDSVVLLNLGASWSSPQDNFTITGYIRNATDKEYKTVVQLPAGAPIVGVTVGDPRIYGVMISAKF